MKLPVYQLTEAEARSRLAAAMRKIHELQEHLDLHCNGNCGWHPDSEQERKNDSDC